MNRTLRTSLLFALVAAGGCETGGVFPLLTRRDVLQSCETPTSTWLRTATDATKTTTTEILVIGSVDPTDEVIQILPRCFVRTVVDYDASTIMDAGEYTLDIAGDGTFNSYASYTYPIRRVSVFSRPGASRRDNKPAVPHAIRIENSGSRLLVTYDGVQHVYTNLYEVVASVDPSTQVGAEQLNTLMNLPLYMSQVRVPGFGSARMTQYANTTARFDAVVQGQLSVSVQSLVAPNTDLNYTTFEDMSGMLIVGLQETLVNTSGTGPMKGTVSITMRDGPSAGDVYLEGTIGYDDIRITDGFPSSGDFLVETTQPVVSSHRVSYVYANQVDMRPTLPVATP